VVHVNLRSAVRPFYDDLETYFSTYRRNTIGIHDTFVSPYGRKKIIYADWTASGRLYAPIESRLTHDFGPFVANPHTESNITASTITMAYEHAKQIVKQHVNADNHDVIIMDGPGMTSVITKFQRLLGLRIPEQFKTRITLTEEERPVVFVTHMEHHSNQISWVETIADVVSLSPNREGRVDLKELESMLQMYQKRKLKIGSFTSCSNVTGIQTPYHQMARVMHQFGGVCFVDFSASAPYVEINMHPRSPLEKLDAIFYSPHKFLGGPGASGVLVFDSRLYFNHVPDRPGGGTVAWTNPWGEYKYLSAIEAREDGGTPGFLQAIKAALCTKLKEQMGIKYILKREAALKDLLLSGLREIPEVHILEPDITDRLGIVSFCVEDIHYNLVVKLLNDRFGIQCRGGCACAGPYGHYLLNIDKQTSKVFTDLIDKGDLSSKPGWVRISLHPIMTNQEILEIIRAIKQIVKMHREWRKDYVYSPATNEFHHSTKRDNIAIDKLFTVR
jgi:selenocysteine lyase/cysteine desulfurase